MSVFGLIKKGRQAAKEHKASVAEKQKAEAEKPTYRHVPTHAAVDALAKPQAQRHGVERPRLKWAPPLGQNPVHAGMPRVNSALSHVSYPSQNANPMVAVPRTYSYHGGISTPWGERPTEVVYSQPDIHQGVMMPTPRAAVGKGKAVERPVVAGSRASSKAPSPVGSSGESASSQDELELRPSRQHRLTGSTASQTSEDARAAGPVHRYHPSQRPRRPSDPAPPPAMLSADRHHSFSTPADRYPPTSMDRYFQTRTPGNYRPPVPRPGNVAVTAAAGAPPVPSLPLMNFGPSMAAISSSTTPSSASVRSSRAGSSNSPSSSAARPESPVSPVSLTTPASSVSPITAASASRPPTGAPATASPVETTKFDFNFSNTFAHAGPTSPRVPPEAAITPAPAPRVFHLKQASRASLQPNRRLDLEQPVTSTPEPVRAAMTIPASPPTSGQSRLSRTFVVPSQLPTDFDEHTLSSSSINETDAAAPTAPRHTKGKLSKSAQGPKPVKKGRWSFLSSKPAPVPS
ncbi:hypothetical protein MAPG_01794 [Magnaporthiopsis poae ATCC 64411]|uniref:Uncharacterized protein n=1 Tax=Magnaporthiopsis poae (strain ATCC 64411 / 73-15) TaxID=644358 RepID=A0A0C4DPM5_MAGP6|nr:hypothetical protein MAPG_01794 [Magnaporthiopsis poae ATCC 64411]